ncbi:MAG: C4-type zinc ribbon domain-containing protein [Candidatus Alcyoniella australis]|nr:C4-type zinc ribbon domain-containing protein [Candidatus Alcyoniella australis]
MIEQLKTLEQLQEIDLRIDEVKRNQDEYPKQIERYRAQIQASQDDFQLVESTHNALMKQRRTKELDLQQIEERVAADRVKLMGVKTNKEYHAMQKQIENQRADYDELETEILKMMETIEESEHEVRRARERFEQNRNKNQVEVDKLEKQMAAIDDNLEELVDKYDEIAGRIDPALIQRYLHVRKLRRGVAVVPAIKGTCQGCHMKLPPQVYNLVIRNEEIITCPNCHRILYFSEG